MFLMLMVKERGVDQSNVKVGKQTNMVLTAMGSDLKSCTECENSIRNKDRRMLGSFYHSSCIQYHLTSEMRSD